VNLDDSVCNRLLLVGIDGADMLNFVERHLRKYLRRKEMLRGDEEVYS
jgi:hypothetical protein